MSAQHAVLAALAADSCLTVQEIAAATGLSPVQASQAACPLVTRGAIERVEQGCYRITAAGRSAHAAGVLPALPSWTRAQRRPTTAPLRQRAWNAMRVERKFGVAALVRLAMAEGQDVRTVRRAVAVYVNALARAGYLRELPAQGGDRRWALLWNTGPDAPTADRRLTVVADPNTGERHPCR